MSIIKLALIGNPNIGKSSLFNQLTGLRQRVGNYPGITVEKKTGSFQHNNVSYTIYDLPGTYSLYPNSQDEEIAYELIANTQNPDHPNKVIVLADATNLKRSLQLFEQVYELKLPTILVINMTDQAEKQGIKIDIEKIKAYYKTEVVFTNARTGFGTEELKNKLDNCSVLSHQLFNVPTEFESTIKEAKQKLKTENEYKTWHLLAQPESKFITTEQKNIISQIKKEHQIISKRLQVSEVLSRNKHIEILLADVLKYEPGIDKRLTPKIDRIVMHPFWGYIIFGLILFLMFQSIYTFSQWPMKWVESGVLQISIWVKSIMPNGPLQGLITDGVIPGIGGVLIFVPQIAILFFGILLLEETGYMSRVVFLMDRWMQPFGLNGKSVVPLISGAACAIPAIMSARNIENKKERLITVLVTPFMTCSARLPVYSLIIGLVITNRSFLGFNIQGIVLLGMYMIGVIGALIGGLVLRKFIKDKYKSYLVMDIPSYKLPLWKGLFISLWKKISAFVFGAGKIILAISIILWVLASFGPGENFNNAETIIANEFSNTGSTKIEIDAKVKSYKLEHSFLGIMGNWFEPVIKPLGYDWKIGIGIIASFAAREVFVPTMATIYSISDSDNRSLLHEKMKIETNIETGKPVYNFATGISLLMFYAFAMMCMSTFAVVKKETKTWKWPIIQLISMSGLAYIVALIFYQILK